MTAPTSAELREARGTLTQKSASALVYVTTRSWQKWERGDAPMPLALWELFQIKVKPDLLDALESIVSQCDHSFEFASLDLSEARAAIAKAKGEQPC